MKISRDAILVVLAEEYGKQEKLSRGGEPYERARAKVALEIVEDVKAAANGDLELHEILGHLEVIRDARSDKSALVSAKVHNNVVNNAVRNLTDRFENLVHGTECMP